MRADAGRLAEHRRVEMVDDARPAARTRSAAKARKRSEDAPRHCGSLGGKCIADVALGERAEHRVGQRVQHDVAVGMREHAALGRDPDAAEPDVVALGEGMHVEARADAA